MTKNTEKQIQETETIIPVIKITKSNKILNKLNKYAFFSSLFFCFKLLTNFFTKNNTNKDIRQIITITE